MEEEKWRRRNRYHTYEYINQSDFRMQTLGEPKRGEKMKEKRTTLFPIDLNKHTAQHTSFYTAIINGALWIDGRFFSPAPPRAVFIRDDNETITSSYVVRSIRVYRYWNRLVRLLGELNVLSRPVRCRRPFEPIRAVWGPGFLKGFCTHVWTI